MRNILIVLSIFFVFNSCAQTQQLTAFTPGEIWLDNRGIHINAHGGGLLYREGTYYWYGEHKGEKTNAAMVGVTCYSSKDLMNWTYEGVVMPVVTDNDSSDITAGCVIERPKVVYNAKTKKYVLWFHLELKDQGYKAARVAVAVGDSPTGTFKYIRSYRPNAGRYPLNITEEQRNSPLTVEDFKKSWTPEWRLAVENGLFLRRDLAGGQMSRDMTIYVDDDLKAYHIYASEENQTLHIAELSDDYQQHTGRYVRILPGKHNEAPAVLKKDGKYFLISSDCTGWKPNAARMAVADSLFGTWTELGNPCVGEGAELTFSSQSTYIQKVEGKKDMYIFMADRWTPENPIDGRYIWLPVFFEDGKPVLKWLSSWNLNDK
ncbi:MAG: glycoside hydrolase family 43 protein [Bacteroidales bacterium]|jgi:hypothetical protein